MILLSRLHSFLLVDTLTMLVLIKGGLLLNCFWISMLCQNKESALFCACVYFWRLFCIWFNMQNLNFWCSWRGHNTVLLRGQPSCSTTENMTAPKGRLLRGGGFDSFVNVSMCLMYLFQINDYELLQITKDCYQITITMKCYQINYTLWLIGSRWTTSLIFLWV